MGSFDDEEEITDEVPRPAPPPPERADAVHARGTTLVRHLRRRIAADAIRTAADRARIAALERRVAELEAELTRRAPK